MFRTDNTHRYCFDNIYNAHLFSVNTKGNNGTQGRYIQLIRLS